MNYSTPAGYYPQLPTVVTAPGFHTSSTFGTGIDGHLANVRRIDGDRREVIVKDHPLPSREAVKAFQLRRGYTEAWEYLGTSLHPMRGAYKNDLSFDMTA